MSTKYPMKSKSGKDFYIELPPKSSNFNKTGFVIAAHKTGSVLLNNIIKDICQASNVPSVPVEIQTWKQGISIPDWPDELYELMNNEGYVYHGFRGLYKLDQIPVFNSSFKIFLVRDPRDIIVSYYFSMLKSHSIPKQGDTRNNMIKARNEVALLSIDDFVFSGKADFIIKNMIRFSAFISKDANTFLYRYEDIIFKKEDWVKNISEILGANITSNQIAKIAKKHDIFPATEDDSKHIRQVNPGNYKKHLSKKSIEFIENKFEKIFEEFRYEKAKL